MDAKRKPGVFTLILSFLAAVLIFLLAAALLAALSSLLFGTRLPGFTALHTFLPADAGRKITVVIDPGHGGTDPGALSKSGIREKDLNLALAKKLAFLLKSEGVRTVLTREKDDMLSLGTLRGSAKTRDLLARVEAAKKEENAVFVSLHMNSLPSEKYSGLQVFYSANDPRSQVLAQTIQSKTAAFLQPENKREIKKAGSNIFVLDRLQIPAVMVECGFLSNQEEAALLADAAYQDRLAVTIALSILQFAGNES